MADTIRESIEENAKNGVASSSVDGVSVTHKSIDEQIKADQYIASSSSATKNHFGLRSVKLEAPRAG